MVELKVRLGPKGQVVIPQIFRNMFKLVPGKEVIITIERDKGVLIRNQEDNLIQELEKSAQESAKRRKGKKFSYNKEEFFAQYERRNRR